MGISYGNATTLCIAMPVATLDMTKFNFSGRHIRYKKALVF